MKMPLLALLFASQLPFAAAQTFSAPQRYSLPENPVQLLGVDVNHDGRVDIVVLQQTSKTVGIRLRTSTGGFAAEKNFYAGPEPAAIAAGDFNHDGKLDLAVANGWSTASEVDILLGNGDGTFASPVAYAVDGSPDSIAVGDFNNDGRPDIATLSPINDKLTILTNTGSGFSRSSFTVPTFYSAEFPGNGNIDWVFTLTAGDFNGDGRMDLAYADSCQSPDNCGPAILDTHYVLMNTTTGWSGSLVNTATGTTSLHAVDLDNDGRADLLQTYDGCHTPCRGVTVTYSNPGGTFTRIIVAPDDGSLPFDAVVADFNNDGIYDIAAAVTSDDLMTPNGFVIYTGKGGRSGFNSPQYFAINSDAPRTLAAGFISNDGRADILEPDGGTSGVKLMINTTPTAADPCAYPTAAGIHLCLPKAGLKTSSKTVRFLASAHPQSQPINRIELWVDGHKKFQTFNDRLDKKLTLTSGSHTGTIVRVDATGVVAKSNVAFSVP